MSGATRRALLSVSDKTGIVELGQALLQRGFTLLSTGGTARHLTERGVEVTQVSSYTGFPEILDGRVKTLHPAIHAGLLARRDLPEHRLALAAQDIGTIDFLAVNLYPFQATIAREDCTFDEAIENIDIGGPAMLRSAAKNHAHVVVLVDPVDYARVLELWDSQGGKLDGATREELAQKVFVHTAQYDASIAQFLSRRLPALPLFPQSLQFQLALHQEMRYGENPHQSAAFYRDVPAPLGTLATYRQLQGKELSYNNLADADAAWECVRAFDDPACVIVKHANPCGVAIAKNAASAYAQAFRTDPISAYGGIIAFNRELDLECAEAVAGQFAEVVIAPSVSDAARQRLAAKSALRLLVIAAGTGSNKLEFKRVGGGVLVQTPDMKVIGASDVTVVTERKPGAALLADMLFCARVAKYVKSNAIVFAAAGMTLGIGAGQMSRIDAAHIAVRKAREGGLELAGSAVASDAFFPFRDGLDVVADAGAAAVIQPGGSLRDGEVIAAANERGMVMAFTGIRHFRH